MAIIWEDELIGILKVISLSHPSRNFCCKNVKGDMSRGTNTIGNGIFFFCVY